MIEPQQIEKKIIQDIQSSGFAIIEVADSNEPNFGYTIGLFRRFSHPEIIVVGLPTGVITSILSLIGEQVRNGHRIAPNQNYIDIFIEKRPVVFLEAKKDFYKDYVGWSNWYNQEDYEVLQMIWPDRDNHFPWDPDFDISLLPKQPLLDREPEYLFNEKRNLGIYTTHQVLENKQPILYTYHENDGDWQFICGTTTNQDDLKIVSLEEILKIDPTLNAVADLPRGWRAYRENPDSDWIMEIDEN